MTSPMRETATAGQSAVSFEVVHGKRRVRCTVADEALEAVSGLAGPLTPSLQRGSFDRFRILIDAAARLKMESIEPGSVTAVTLTSRDLRRAGPQPGAPAFGTAARPSTRPTTT